jgi:hypothetical protein
MNKKHFEVVAGAVANIYPRRDRWMIANLLANTFEQYPRFDRGRFIAACRPTEESSVVQDEASRQRESNEKEK